MAMPESETPRVVLASRRNAGILVLLLWASDTNSVAVVVRDTPANASFEPCLPCPRVPARAQADVPVSYPRAVVSFSNSEQLLKQRTAKRPSLLTIWIAAQGDDAKGRPGRRKNQRTICQARAIVGTCAGGAYLSDRDAGTLDIRSPERDHQGAMQPKEARDAETAHREEIQLAG